MPNLKSCNFLKNEKEEDIKQHKRHKKYIVGRTKIICFLSLVLIHILDLISTIIGLALGAYEINIVVAYLHTFGVLGIILGSIYVIGIFIFAFYVISFLERLYLIITYKDMPTSLICTLYIIISTLLFVSISLALLNNIVIIVTLI